MPFTLLFVDDEPRILKAFQRQLRHMRKEWDLFYVTSGDEAMAILERYPVDVIISDMKMPGMDGEELLGHVREQYPATVRIILSGHSDEKMVRKTVAAAHQFMAKPCSIDVMKDTLQKARFLKTLLKNEQLRELVSGTNELPSLPHSYAAIVDEIQAERPSLEKIGRIISQDVSMTARILQLVNSPFFGVRYPIRDIQHAVTYLGLDLLKSLVLLLKIFSSMDKGVLSLDRFANHCLQVASLAKSIMLQQQAGYGLAELGFTTGILHDIGRLVLMNQPGVEIEELDDALLEKEDAEQGRCHAEIGAYLLGIWGIPEEIVKAVAYHHNPSGADEPGLLLAAVHAAEIIVLGDDTQLDSEFMERRGLLDQLPHWRAIYVKQQKEME